MVEIIGNITSWGGLIIAVLLLVDKFRNGTSATQKEIRETYKERADQLEGIVDELKTQVDTLTIKLEEFQKDNVRLTRLIENRNPELERILTEISHFLSNLSDKVEIALNISAQNKDYLLEAKRRHDEIDREFGPQLMREIKAREENTDRSKRNEERNQKIDRDTNSGQGQVLRKK